MDVQTSTTFLWDGSSNEAQHFLGESLVCGFPVQALFNPTTHIFEGMRAVLTQPRVLMIVFAATNARGALKQK